MRKTAALVLTLAMVLTSISMAVARGQNPDIGTEMVICTGVGMTTVTIGPDGEPVETTHICPDSLSIFAATFALPALVQPEPRLLAHLSPSVSAPHRAAEALTPSARGPPASV